MLYVFVHKCHISMTSLNREQNKSLSFWKNRNYNETTANNKKETAGIFRSHWDLKPKRVHQIYWKAKGNLLDMFVQMEQVSERSGRKVANVVENSKRKVVVNFHNHLCPEGNWFIECKRDFITFFYFFTCLFLDYFFHMFSISSFSNFFLSFNFILFINIRGVIQHILDCFNLKIYDLKFLWRYVHTWGSELVSSKWLLILDTFLLTVSIFSERHFRQKYRFVQLQHDSYKRNQYFFLIS